MKKMLFLAAFACQSAFAGDPSAECMESIPKQARFEKLGQKVALINAKEQNFSMLSDTTKVQKAEKPIISAWVGELERCFALGAEFRSKNMHPYFLSLLEIYKTNFLIATADLHAGKTTYGDFAKLRAEKLADINKAWSDFQQAEEERKRLATEKQREKDFVEKQRLAEEQRQRMMQEEQQDSARRQMALNYLLNQRPYQAPQMQPYIMPAPRPTVTTNCQTYGSQTNCLTR